MYGGWREVYVKNIALFLVDLNEYRLQLYCVVQGKLCVSVCSCVRGVIVMYECMLIIGSK